MRLDMSGIDAESEIYEPEVQNSVKHDDVKKKFRLYRSNVDDINTKYKEARNTIDRLKEEIQISQEVEKSQRMRITSLQNRLTLLEEKGRKLHDLSETQRINSEQIRKMNENISNISNLVQELKQKCQSVIVTKMNEINTIKRNKHLQSVVETKEEQLNKLKKELESGLCEKEELIEKYKAENEELKREIVTSNSEAKDLKDSYDQLINTQKQKLVEYERIIEEMEKERRRLLGDYDVSIPHDTSTTGNNNETWPDSTVTCLTEERIQPLTKTNSILRKENCFQYQGQVPEPVPSSQKTSRSSHFSKFAFKKPKLDFLDSSIESTPRKEKRRIYSQNSNHYLMEN